MSIASVHIADVGVMRAVRMMRRPRRVAGLISANTAFANPLRDRDGSAPKPMPGRVALVAFWEDDEALTAFVADHPYAAGFAEGWWCRLRPVRAHGTWPGLDPEIDRSRAATEA